MVRGKKLIIATIIALLIVISGEGIRAEVGNSGGFGGGSSGGSSGGGYGGSSSSSWGDSSSGGSGEASPVAILIMVCIFGFAAVMKIKEYSDSTSQNQESGFYTEWHDQDKIIKEIQTTDPNFDGDKFKDYVGKLYINLQESWEAKDWKGIRVFESDALFNMHRRQLQEYIDHQKTNHLNNQSVDSVCLCEYKVDETTEVLIVRLNAYCVDYVQDDNSGALLEGSRDKLNERSYRLEFIRSKGAQTIVDQPIQLANCPNCGAEIQISSSGECEYCHSVITNGKYGWVLNKYGAW